MSGPFLLEIPLTVSPSNMFNALIVKSNTNIPMVVPQVITKIQPMVDGTKVVSFGRGTPYESSTVTVKIDSYPEQFTCKCTFEGDAVVMNNLKSISYDIKFIYSDKGSTYQCSTNFTTNDGLSVKDIVVQADKAYQTYIVKAIEAYCIAKSKH